MFQYSALFTYIYQHLALFAPIWSYLPLIALIWPYMPYITPYIYILLVRLHPYVQNLKQSENESWRITDLAHRKSYLVIIFPNSHEKLTKSEIR